MKVLAILAGIALTVLCWGSYGPVLHNGQNGLDNSKLKPFICVGIAYFFVAIIVPVVLLASRGELAGGWSLNGISWSLFAGAAGAFGALGIIIALSSGGRPVYVMPIVFGCAPVISVLIAILMSRERPNPFFYAGLILVAVGAVVVLFFQPKKVEHAQSPAAAVAKPAAGSSEDETTSHNI